jgi:tetratricopeptide (TPR) repeat protein
MKIKRIVAFLGLLLSIAAIPSFSQTQPSRQQQLEEHKRKAREYLRQNKPELAIPELRATIALDPKDVDALGNLGVLLFFKGDYAGATPQLRAAVQLRPDLWKIQALLGMSEKRTGDAAAARATLEKAFPKLEEQKIRVQAGMEMIDLYSSTGDLDKAAGVIDVLREADPTNVELLYTSYRIHSDLAHEAVLSMGAIAPDSPRMHQMMAHELAKQGNTAAAIANYREAIKIDPQLPGIHFELAEILNAASSTENQEEIEKEYKAALTANPFDEKAECRLAEIARRKNDLKEAYARYSRALELQPKDAEAAAGLAKVLASRNEREKALELYRKALQLEPTNATVHFQLSTLYRQMGRQEDAQRELGEYKKYKEMKEKLRVIYRDMRQEPRE